MPDQVLDVSKVAARTGVGPDQVRKWLKQGEFPNAFNVGEESRAFWRIPAKDVDLFVARRQRLSQEAMGR